MGTMTGLLDGLQVEVDAAKAEIVKFEGGNKSAGSRVRKAMQNVKGLAQELRVAIQAAKNADK